MTESDITVTGSGPTLEVTASPAAIEVEGSGPTLELEVTVGGLTEQQADELYASLAVEARAGVFTSGLQFTVPASSINLGAGPGSITAGGDLLIPAFGAFAPAGIVILLTGQTDPMDNGFYSTSATTSTDNVFPKLPEDHQPLRLANVGRLISVNVVFGTSPVQSPVYKIRASGPTEADVFLEDVNESITAAYEAADAAIVASIGEPSNLRDRADVFGALRDWDESTDARLRCYPTAASMGAGSDGVWQITSGGSTGTLPATPAGIDVRMFGLFRSPYRDAELPALQAWPYQQFREWFTQTRAAASGGDTLEFALLHTWSPSWDAIADAGLTLHFGESTIIGGTGEGPGLYLPDPFGPLIGVPVYLRGTIDCANETMTLWRGLPYPIGLAGAETADGIYWAPVGSRTDPQYASMRDDGAASETYKLGIQSRMDYGWIKAYEFGDPTPILDIGPAELNAAVGATSFVDAVGNTITTVAGVIE